MKIDQSVLREYDIRGIAGETLDEDAVRAVGKSFGTVVKRDGGRTVCVGYDGRLSSPDLEAALVQGLASTGLSVVRTGRGPTPMLYFATHILGADAGAMVTGSHNPPEYNGVKMVKGGESFFGKDIQTLGEMIAQEDFETGDGSVSDQPVFPEYVSRLEQDYRPGKALTVAWDPGNGAAGEVVDALVKKLPGRHIVINTAIDGTFPNHHPDPTVEENLEQLVDPVKEEDCDLGIGFDGDGDRIGVVDGRGRMLYGDQLLLILAGDVLKAKPGAIVIGDVKASQVLYDGIEALGGKPLMWAAGHSLIKAKMHETEAPLAGEMSGHIFFADKYYGYDDAVYSAVRLLCILANSKESLADMYDAMPKTLSTPEVRFECPEDRKFTVVEEVARCLKADGADVVDIDGVRVNSDDGWWLLRASNTQPALTARCEGKDEAGLARLKDTLRKQLAASDVELPDM